MKTPGLYGLVLAGGKSTRIGKDKGLINYHGKPHRDYLFELLEPLCEKTFTSCRQDQQVALHRNPVYDSFDFASPLNGILSAFQLHPAKTWLTVAVDMPFINEETLRFLIAGRNATKLATCFLDSDEKLPEPMITIWESRSLHHLQSFVAEGNISPREFLIQSSIQTLKIPNSNALVNVNMPADLSRHTSPPK